MYCDTTRPIITNDSNGKLIKTMLRAASKNGVVNHSTETILAGYLNGDSEFRQFVKESGRVNQDFTNYDEINQNVLYGLLKDFFNKKHLEVNHSATLKHAEALYGFTSSTAKQQAIAHTADQVIAIYYEEFKKPKSERLSYLEILNRVKQEISKRLEKEVFQPLLERLKSDAFNNKKGVKEALNLIKSLDEELKAARNNHKETIANPKASHEDKKAATDRAKKAVRDYEVARENLINQYEELTGDKNGADVNYCNLVSQIKTGNAWLKLVFTSSKLTNITREFDKAIDDSSSVTDIDDFENSDNRSLDEMAKSWEDSLHKSFDHLVSGDLKLYLNSLFDLDSADANWDAKNNQWVYQYSRNTEIGVPMTMSAQFIISQICNGFVSFNSVDDFIDDVERLSKLSPKLFGLIKFVNDMRNDRAFAYKAFNQLHNPRISKFMVVLTEEGINFTESNQNSTGRTSMLYRMMNSIKSTANTAFNVEDSITAERLIIEIEQYGISLSPNDKDTYETIAFNFILNTLKKYFPDIEKSTIRNYLYSSNFNKEDIFVKMLSDIKDLLYSVEKFKTAYNDLYNEFINGKLVDGKRVGGFKIWAMRRNEDPSFDKPAPVFDQTKLPYEIFNKHVISLVNKLNDYSIAKIELNSTNAEGNMQSDLINNSYITNLLQQIAFGTEENSQEGLRKLADFVSQGEQYLYNPIYFGIRDENNKVIQEGLFTRHANGKIDINPDAKNLITIALFNGAKDNVGQNAALYDSMSKNDYFLSNLIAFHNFINIGTSDLSSKASEYGGFFLRIPSDAPKNFILQTKKYDTSNLWINSTNEETNYIRTKLEELIKNNNGTKESKYNESILIVSDLVKLEKKNKYKIEDFYDVLNNGIVSFNYNNTYHIIKDDRIYIPLVLNNDIIWISGKQIENIDAKQLEDIKIEELYLPESDNNSLRFNSNFTTAIRDSLIEEGVISGNINRRVNTNNIAFRALYTHLFGELNNFVNNLNNVFEFKNGEWVIKTDVTEIFERAHYNITYDDNGDPQTIVQGKWLDKKKTKANPNVGKLSGNFFKFLKLFETSDYNANEEIEKIFSLYGGDNALLKQGKTTGTLVLNTNRTDIIKIEDGRISLNLPTASRTNLNQIITNWLQSYHKDIIDGTKQFNKILVERYSLKQVVDCLLNNAIMEMSFDDIFEGGIEFYKDAQEFLKRAKEVQAGGKSYGGFNLRDDIGSALHTLTDKLGKEEVVTINGRPLETARRWNGTPINISVRNGFRGVTIENTINSSEMAPIIRDELIKINEPELGTEEATRIANEIAKGYFDKTKFNDAQSYITFEEWIRRKYLDGTINDYAEIIQHIYDVKNGKKNITDLDLKGINARIQVQKNFYFDKQYDPKTKCFYPRQIKNAEFVIIPELVKGTDLEVLYNIMNEYGIDQINTVETDKAAKRTILNFWDNNGVANADNFRSQLQSTNAYESYYYRYLYKQQDVAQHLVDERNKAGIQIMKKILDNANDEVKPEITKLVNNFVANIKDDFRRLITDMGWVVNEDGSLSNPDGSKQLNFEEFYKRARVEAQRVEMNSNFIEYLTPTELGSPLMPNYMNIVATKLESIAQSLFNNAITRQTLPGWHAAQVTSIGHGVKVLDSKGNFRKLKYHPTVTDENGNVTQEAYAEVLIPRWSNLIPKDYDISKLESEGLDIHIGYRIPTEGKQSVSVLKVVGFLDDIYGSTIMVPDEWVTQTGSDFDVDSIYGICYEMFKDSNGVLHKITSDNDTSIEGVERRYCHYINSLLESKIKHREITDEFIKDETKELYNQLQDENTRYRQENNKAFRKTRNALTNTINKLPVEDRNIINKLLSSKSKNKYEVAANELAFMPDKTNDENLKSLYLEAMELAYAIHDLTNTINENYKKFREAKSEKVKQLFAEAREEYFDNIKAAAKKQNLVSFEEFTSWSLVDQQDRRARNNKILDAMVAIMNNENSREENYSRSNFDDLTDSLNKMKDLLGISKAKRSAYNPLDQIQFFENAISGRKLKAFSVTRDTFNSICNFTKAELGDVHQVSIIYDLSTGLYGDISTPENKKATLDKLRESFDSVIEIENTDLVKIIHNRIGNTLNNRNVVGKLLTPYSSQTTAHILDAIKEGAIPNENEFTFGTFKTLLDIGSDYDTAIAFIMQPAISRIVEAHNENNSIYMTGGGNAVHTAIKRIAKDLGILINGKPVNDYTSIKSVYYALNKNEELTEAFKRVFGAEFDSSTYIDKRLFSLNGKLLKQRLNSENKTNNSAKYSFEQAAFDIATILNFESIYQTTKNIEAIANLVKSDSFGAKQTIHSTRKIKDNIIHYITDENKPVANTVKIGATDLLSAIYPGIEEGNINVEKSAYPYLAAFFKYSTNYSVDINSQLFITESEPFVAITNTIESKLGNINLAPEQHQELVRYIVQNIYRSVPFLTTPLTVDENGYITYDADRIKNIIEREKITLPNELLNNYYDLVDEYNNNYWEFEKYRIFGYDVVQSSNLEVIDVNKPTKEEIAAFNELTPAQKVIWIQQNIKDNAGIFNHLNVNMFHQGEYKTKGYSGQSIRYNDQITNIEELFIQFDDSFFNKNPLIRLAAIDLIKYAFVVEGFRFKKGSISKIITNKSIYADLNDKGMALVPAIEQAMNLSYNLLDTTTDDFINKFISSHSEYTKLVKLPKNDAISKTFDGCLTSENIVYIPFVKDNANLLERLTIEAKDPKHYIRINRFVDNNKRKEILYKIVKTENGVYLLPMNKLERNETDKFSVNKNNVLFRDIKYYQNIVNYIIENETNIKQLSTDGNALQLIEDWKGKFTIKPRKFIKVVDTVNNAKTLMRLQDYGTDRQKSVVNKFINDVNKVLDENKLPNNIKPLIFNPEPSLQRMFPINMPVVQILPTGEETRKVSITRVKPSKSLVTDLTSETPTKKVRESIPKNELVLLNDIKATKTINPALYKIELLKETEVEQEYNEAVENSDKERDKFYSTTSTISLPVDEEFEYEDIDKVGVRMYDDINKQARIGDETALNFKQSVDIVGINRQSGRSIQSNRKSLFESASEYYTRRSIELNNNIEKFECLDGSTFAINDPALYEHLRENPEDYFRLVKVILDAKTFGGTFAEIFNLNLDSEDPLTKKYIEDIKTAINRIKDNKRLVGKNGALNLLFNDYLANEYSSNPLIRRGLIELTSKFDDINWWELNIGDIGDVSHKQIQAVVSLVYNIINTATTVIGPRAVAEFKNKVAEIEAMSGELNYDKIIPNGEFIKLYNEDFIKHKEEVFQKVRDAKEQFGEFSKEHFEAKLERDEWLLKYTHQPYIDEYYEKRLKLQKDTYKIAGEDFLNFLRLKEELNRQNKDFALMSKEERDKYDETLAELRKLQSDITGPEFAPELKDLEAKRRSDAIRNYAGAIKRLNGEYFDTKEKANFRDTLTYFVKIKKNYEESHPNETLDMRLQDPDYRRAYDWIQHNSTYKVSDEVQKQIDEAYKKLYPTSRPKNSDVYKIIKENNAYDIYGNINPKLLTNTQIQAIKDLIIYDKTRHDGSSEDRVHLIKDIPTGLPIYSEDFYKKIRGEKEFDLETNAEILKVSKRINELIRKGFEKDGNLSTIKLFNELSKEELKELGNLYKELRNLRKKKQTDPKHSETIKAMTSSGELQFKINTSAYNSNFLQRKTLSVEEQQLWNEIFTKPNGPNLVPNDDIFGYIEAAPKFIDSTLTNMKELLDDNIINKPTEYYYEAEKEARYLTEEEKEGLIEEQIKEKTIQKYNEWFELNHTFNHKTKRMEPLFIWTTREINPNGSLKGSYSYVPTYENTNRKIKNEYSNKLYTYGLDNYKVIDDDGIDKNPYSNKTSLTEKEIAMLNLFKNQIKKYVINNRDASYTMKKFAKEGKVPRRPDFPTDAKFYLDQALGSVGLQVNHTGDADWIEDMNYTDDIDVPFPMMQTIKTKGYKEKIPMTPRGVNESLEEYQKRLDDNRKQNKEIEKHNAKLEEKILDKNWVNVFEDFIFQAEEYNAKVKAKDSIYLLMEDLKSRGAYKLTGYKGNIIKDRSASVEEQTEYKTKKQERAISLTETFLRRLIYNQYKKNQPFVKYADLMQNVTSAKYMIFNVTGGFANIGTGTANILGEVFAKDYFDIKTWGEAQGEYFGNALSILADMYKPTSNNETAAILKHFNIVNLDSITERRNNESAAEYTRRIQDALYSFQSGGEHYMQNTALLAMLRSHRVIEDKQTGKWEVKTFYGYAWDIEVKVLEKLIANDEQLLTNYNNFIKSQKADLNQMKKYDNFIEDFNENFLRKIGDKELIWKYIKERDKALEIAKTEFKNYPTVRSQVTVKNGLMIIKPGSNLTDNHLGSLRSKGIKVNDKIHGVYHKIGAAKIEAEWWGGLVMQYHKHIYPGIMKRWRNKGYYNEIRESIERGSYMSIYKFLSTEFRHAIKDIKDNDDTTAIESVKSITKAAIDTIININLNYQLLPVWEQNNMKRALGDLLGVTSAFLLATGVHIITDEDELEESNFYATLIYMADRLNSEAQMYTPWGLWTEASTLWSSPIAAQNGPKDLIKGLSIGIQALYDEDFNINYTTGLYKGQNKLAVLLYRNTPIYRVYQRLSTMDKNNSYYRINETALNIKFAKTIADEINPD